MRLGAFSVAFTAEVSYPESLLKAEKSHVSRKRLRAFQRSDTDWVIWLTVSRCYSSDLNLSLFPSQLGQQIHELETHLL